MPGAAPYKKAGGRGGGGGGRGGRGGGNNNKGGRGGGQGRGHGGGGGGGGKPQQGGGNGLNKQGQSVLTAMLNLLFQKNQETIYQNGVLNLDNFHSSQDLQAVRSSINFNTKDFCESLCSTIRATVVDPQFISINNNEIKTLFYFLDALKNHGMANTLHGIQCRANPISNVDWAAKLKGFPNLNTLFFNDCPVVNRGDYFTTLKKSAPGLLSLDGNAINRPPLGLPWPTPTQRSDALTNALVWLDQTLFQAVASQGVDAITNVYHQNAIFTLTTQNYHINTSVTNGNNNNNQQQQQNNSNIKHACRDLQKFRQDVDDKDRNIVASKHITRCATGRTRVIETLAKAVYPRNIAVEHKLDENAEVVAIPEGSGVKLNMIVLTIHGQMRWKHQYQDVSDKHLNKCTFDRTFTLLPDGNGYTITNDVLHYRQYTGNAILVPLAESRVVKLSNRHGIPKDVMRAIISLDDVDSDAAMVRVIEEIKILPGDVVGNIQQVCNGDATQTLAMARMVFQMAQGTGLQPQYAWQCIFQAEANPEKAMEIFNSNFNSPQYMMNNGGNN